MSEQAATLHLDAGTVALLADALADKLAPTVTLLDAHQAAALLNVPASWVLAEARADRIPHVRLGRYVRFDRGELQAWWAQRARGPRHTTNGTTS